MKDPYALLLQKEKEIQCLRREIEALRTVLPLLAEDSALETSPVANFSNKWPLEVPGRR
jgi:hypothetical protein